MPTTIALIANESQRESLVRFIQDNQVALSRYQLIAPERTAQYLRQGAGIEVEALPSFREGGDLELVARILKGHEIAALIFLLDPGIPLDVPEIQTLIRACNLHDVPFATNRATAIALLSGLTRHRKAHLIFNPVAGNGNAEQDLVLIRQLLEPHIHLKVSFTTPDIGAGQLAKEAVEAESDLDLIVASGGDGTVSSVAGAAIGTDIPLAVIPRGTANAFCMALGIPGNIRGACNTIIAGVTRIVDAARCNEHPMILLAGIGYEAETISKADGDAKQRWGPLAYVMAGLQQLDEQTPFETEIEIDGTTSRVQSGAVTVANAAPPTSILAQGLGQVIPDDGQMEVLIFVSEQNQKLNKMRAIAGMMELFGSALLKTGTQRDNMIGLRAKKVKINTKPAQKVVLDGEIIGTTPLEIECIPKSLKIITPASFSAFASPESMGEKAEEVTVPQEEEN